jgi:hypothetical protein
MESERSQVDDWISNGHTDINKLSNNKLLKSIMENICLLLTQQIMLKICLCTPTFLILPSVPV